MRFGAAALAPATSDRATGAKLDAISPGVFLSTDLGRRVSHAAPVDVSLAPVLGVVLHHRGPLVMNEPGFSFFEAVTGTPTREPFLVTGTIAACRRRAVSCRTVDMSTKKDTYRCELG
jgi:hypothetical protein